MVKVSVVIPAHNEEKRIGNMLENYISYFNRLKNEKILDFELIVVLNACKDNTLKLVKKYNLDELKILNFKRGGKGFAIVEGFKEALRRNSELIGFVDADMSTPPNAFYGLIKHIGNYGGIIANRWDDRSDVKPKQNLQRRILSRGYNFLIRTLFLFDYKDTQCGAKLFKRELIEKIYSEIGASEWGFDVNLLFYAKKEKARIKSIPTMWHDREGSSVNLKRTPITMFLSAVRLRLIHSPFRFIVRAYKILPEKWQFHRMI